jgi:hypothetical protein
MPITFSSQDVKLARSPHTGTMVLTVHIDKWDITKILINNGSRTEILFLAAFDKMGFYRKQLQELTKPLYGFDGKWIEPVGVITLPMSFGIPKNPRTKFITFDIVDILYPYNAIFGRGLLNTFKAALHSGYLCLKILATFRVVSIFGSQQEARNIERGFTPGHRNIHFMLEEPDQHSTSTGQHKAEAMTKCMKVVEVKSEFKKVPLNPRVPVKIVCIGAKARHQEQAKLLAFLDKNNDVFTWSTSDLVGVSTDIIEHRLQVSPSARRKKQKLSKMSEEKVEAVKTEVQRLLKCGFHQGGDLPSKVGECCDGKEE